MEHYENFKEELQIRTAHAEEIIRRYLPVEAGFARTMAEAMNYSMCAGGKRLRPILLLETFRMFGEDERVAEPFMAGIEMIHTHSLIHDDLPAIDNDDYRRGRPGYLPCSPWLPLRLRGILSRKIYLRRPCR